MRDDRRRYDYRLTFIQWLLNPSGVAAFHLMSISSCLTMIAWAVVVAAKGKITFAVVLWATIMILFFGLLLVLFSGSIGYGNWKSSKANLWIEFRDGGLATNFGGLSHRESVFPYNMVSVANGLAHTMVIRNESGHYILVSKNRFSSAELASILRKVAGDLR